MNEQRHRSASAAAEGGIVEGHGEELSIDGAEGNSRAAEAYEAPMPEFCGRCRGDLAYDDERLEARCRSCAAHERPTLHPGADDGAIENAARIAMTEEGVLAYLQASLATIGGGALQLAPAIAPEKEATVRRVHHAHIKEAEPVLAVFDDTVLGSAACGFVVTPQRLAWKNLVGEAASVPWVLLDPDAMYLSGARLLLGGDHVIEVSGPPEVLQACADAFYVVALSARRPSNAHASGVVASMRLPEQRQPQQQQQQHAPTFATPPPPHAVSFQSYAVHAISQRPPAFACWHCRTPLYWNTPQCAHCGATPAARAWLRTA